MMIILLVTTLVWIVWVLSESMNYSVKLKVHVAGIDTAKYVVVECDSIVTVDIESDGFTAIRRYLKMRNREVEVNMDLAKKTSYGRAIGVNDWLVDFKQELSLKGLGTVRGHQDSLRVVLAERQSKAFCPKIKNVQFDFAMQYGLNGTPKLIPDTVWLYGSEKSLSKIEELYTQSMVISNMSDSGEYLLPLEPVWESYPDVYPSQQSVMLYVPISTFSEKEFDLPVKFVASDTTLKVRIYPEKVHVKMLVDSKQYNRLMDDMIELMVRYDERSGEKLPVIVSRFPEYARVKTIEPQSIQYVIIK